jgi:hypothetical protein
MSCTEAVIAACVCFRTLARWAMMFFVRLMILSDSWICAAAAVSMQPTIKARCLSALSLSPLVEEFQIVHALRAFSLMPPLRRGKGRRAS